MSMCSDPNVNKPALPTEFDNINTDNLDESTRFAVNLTKALAMKEVSAAFANIFSGVLNDTNVRIDKIENENIVRDKKIEEMNTRIDDLEQKMIEKNLILAGLTFDPTPITVTNELNKLLGMQLNPSDIHYTAKIRQRDSNARPRIRIVLKDITTKRTYLQCKVCVKR